jgi:hypothetical protein
VVAVQTQRVASVALAWLAAGMLVVPAFAAPYSRLQVLLPGESPAPGTTSGKNGAPTPQVTGVPFTITVNACDATWNPVTDVGHVVDISSTDASAQLPASRQLASGTGSFTVTFGAAGTFTVTAHDATDNTIPDATSSSVPSQLLHGFQFSRITQKNQVAGSPMSTTLTARDPAGNVVAGYSGPVHLDEVTSFGTGRVSPVTVMLQQGSWSGAVTMYRADESSINRGNVNLYAFLDADPSKNGTSDPFTVHPGAFSRVQLVVPGEAPFPGSVTGHVGTPASQAAGVAFSVSAYSTDAYWNPLPSVDGVRIISSDAAASTPVSGALANGSRTFSVSLGTVGSQTLTISDQTNGSIQGMTSAGIQVLPSAADHFVFDPFPSPVTAGAAVAITIRAVDQTGNTIPDFAGDARLSANTGAGSMSPELISFANGVWSGNMVFRGAGGSVTVTCMDFSSPPHLGSSGGFVVDPGPFSGMQVLLPGESPRGGTADGREGMPQDQSAGTHFTLTLRAVDAYWNLVNASPRAQLGSTDAFAAMPADTTLTAGQLVLPVTLFRTGPQLIWVSDAAGVARPDTSSAVQVGGGPFARVLVLAPGESPAPGTQTGRTGTATDQSINYAFNLTVLATDSWWNPVGGVSDVVQFTCSDAMATLPAPTALIDGRADVAMRLAAGGFQQIGVADQSDASKTGSSTQVRAISSGFHLEAAVAQTSARAGDPFTLTVRVTNDAGSVIQEINSFVTIEVQNANTQAPGRGLLATTQFQLLQGQRSVGETYTFAEPIVLVAHDDAGNMPGITGAIRIDPAVPAVVQLSSSPTWVGGNHHAALSAHVVDRFANGIPNAPVAFSLLLGTGTLTPVDAATNAEGAAAADFLSPRHPEVDRIRATSGALTADLDLETAFVDPNAAGGTIASYPNPFHPRESATTIAYKLADAANVTLQIFTLTGDLVRRVEFQSGAAGGTSGLNSWAWDGKNGGGDYVSSGGYIVRVEARGIGETLHVMRRKIAVVQ